MATIRSLRALLKRRPARTPCSGFRPALECLERRLTPSISVTLSVPDQTSRGVTNSLLIKYANTATTPAPAPVLVISSDRATLWLPSAPDAKSSQLQVLATNPNGPAGTLGPGASGTIVVNFTSTISFDGYVRFNVGQLTPGQPIDWPSLKASLQPSFIPASAWDQVFANFTASVGNTTSSYQAALDADATYLAQLGQPTSDASALVAYEINKADAAFGATPQGGTTDIYVSAPGPDLTFARVFQPTISGRNQTGLLGLGWTSNWDLHASADSQGNVTIRGGSGLRYFSKQSDGSFTSVLGDHGTLTAVSGGGYELTETDGSITDFNSNGSFKFFQDANGNRITATYNAGAQLIRLTHSDGDALAIAYNTQGLISQVIDAFGETAKYSYDATGHLLSVTTPHGLTQYNYVGGTGTPADNALESITAPTGTSFNYTYDRRGRLAGSYSGTLANPINPVTIRYPASGGVQYVNANGAQATILYTSLGVPALLTDPLGRTTRLSYDPSGNLIQAVLPGGTVHSYRYDLQGNLIGATDGMDRTTSFAYDARSNLTSSTDPKGNITRYGYDSHNNMLSISYANGAGKTYTYNPLGQATQLVNGRGQATGYTYNQRGQITRQTFADASSYTYTYDAFGNLASATDAQQHVTKFTYGGDASNASNPDLLTRVDYPDGTFLKFTYYTGGQRKQSIDQTGFTVNYSYDAVGRLVKLTDGNGGVIVQYVYDPVGSLIRKDLGNGTRTNLAYNLDGTLKSITNLAADHKTLNSYDLFTYSAVGNVLTDTNQNGQWVYTYDLASQLTRAKFTPNAANPDRLAPRDEIYGYDAAGNRISQNQNGVITTYVVNNVNEYTSSTRAGVTTAYHYDADGNLTSQVTGASTTAFSFNQLSELTGINGPGLTASYSFDALGNRVSQTVNGATTNFQIDPDLGIVASFYGTGVYKNTGGLQAHYTYGFGLVSQVSAAGVTGYYDFGLTGNTIGITNAAGKYVNKYAYAPFGQTTVLAAKMANLFTFVGQSGVVQDSAGLFSMGAREYAAALGQFLSQDPLGIGGADWNLRRYVANNPTNLIDPAGTEAVWTQDVTGAVSFHMNLTPDKDEQSPIGTWERLDRNGIQYSNPALNWQGTCPRFAGREVWGEVDGSVIPPEYGKKAGVPVKVRELIRAADHEWFLANPDAYYQRQEQTQGVSGTVSIPTTSSYDPTHGLYGKYTGPSVADASKNTLGEQTAVAGKLLTTLGTAASAAANATTYDRKPNPNSARFMEGIPTGFYEVWTGSIGEPIIHAELNYTHDRDPQYNIRAEKILRNDAQGRYQYIIFSSVTFPEEGIYGVTLKVQGPTITRTVVTPDLRVEYVYDAPITVAPVRVTVHAGQFYDGPIASFHDEGPEEKEKPAYNASYQFRGTATEITTDDIRGSGHDYYVYAHIDFRQFRQGSTSLIVSVYDRYEYGPGQAAGQRITVPVDILPPTQPRYTSSVVGQVLMANATRTADPPLAVIYTTDPAITSASQVKVGVAPRASIDFPTPLVTGVTLTRLAGGLKQIVINGVMSVIHPGAGSVTAVPLRVTLGTEPTMTVGIIINQTAGDFVVNPVAVAAIAGTPLKNLQVATLSGPANGAYQATIAWGDGETSVGQIVALGGGEFAVLGTKPHPYAKPATRSITVSVTGPGLVPTASAHTSVVISTQEPPTVTSVSPISGPPTGGRVVTITGVNLAGLKAVLFGTTPATRILSATANKIVVLSPPRPLGPGQITVITAGGVSTASPTTQFSYVATPIVRVIVKGGIYTGKPFVAAASVTAPGGAASASLEGVAPVVSYFAGTRAVGTPLTGAPVSPGTYTAVAVFTGSAHYSTAASLPVTFTILPPPPKTLALTTSPRARSRAKPDLSLESGFRGG